MSYINIVESKGIDDKKAKYFNSLNKYMSLKYTQKERSGGLVSNMISEVNLWNEFLC